jgi:hypothetical protein
MSIGTADSPLRIAVMPHMFEKKRDCLEQECARYLKWIDAQNDRQIMRECGAAEGSRQRRGRAGAR